MKMSQGKSVLILAVVGLEDALLPGTEEMRTLGY